MNGRYKNDIPINPQKTDELMASVDKFLLSRKYRFSSSTGEAVYCKGGKIKAPQYIMVEFRKDTVHIEAWIKFLIFPNISVGEFDFKGYSGLYAQRTIKKDVDKLEKIINSSK